MCQEKECRVCAAPAHVLWSIRQNAAANSEKMELAAEVVEVCQNELMNFASGGVRHVEFVDATWGRLCGIGLSKTWGAGMVDTLECQEQALEINNRALCNIPPEMEITFYAPNAPGCYEVVAERLFGHENVRRYKLDFDASRIECLDVLRYVPDGCFVVANMRGGGKKEIDRSVKEISCRLPFDRFIISTAEEGLSDVVDRVIRTYWRDERRG